MALKALKLDYSTKTSIIYIACCKIVLMFYNDRGYDAAKRPERVHS